MTERREQYPLLPPVDWAASKPMRLKRREAVDLRNARIGEVGAAAAVAVVKERGGGITIGAGGKKEAKKT